MLALMKPYFAMLAAIAILACHAARAAAPLPLGPNHGSFGDWTAATFGSGTAKICYAFTRPQSTKPAFPHRSLSMLTVTERHGSPDEISVTPGFTYPAKPGISMQLGNTTIPFYVQGNIAFTDSATAALAGFTRESDATISFTGPHGKKFTDKFSLAGFTAAHMAILKACP
jgi:hypothetical protein